MKRSKKKSKKRSGNKKVPYWVLLISVGLAVMVIVLFYSPEDGKKKIGVGDEVVTSDVKFDCYDQASVCMSDLSGKVVLINFWASWCTPCRYEIPSLVKLYRKYKEEGLEVMGIVVDNRTKKKIGSFVNSMDINYPICYMNREVVDAYGRVRALPTSFIIGRDGKLRYKLVGYKPEKYFERIIRKLLEE